MEEIVKTLLTQCKSTGAAMVSFKAERPDGYEVELTVRKKGAVAFDEFDTAHLNAIRDIFVSDFKNDSRLVSADMALEIVNVCQARLGAPEYNDIQEVMDCLSAKSYNGIFSKIKVK